MKRREKDNDEQLDSSRIICFTSAACWLQTEKRFKVSIFGMKESLRPACVLTLLLGFRRLFVHLVPNSRASGGETLANTSVGVLCLFPEVRRRWLADVTGKCGLDQVAGQANLETVETVSDALVGFLRGGR